MNIKYTSICDASCPSVYPVSAIGSLSLEELEQEDAQTACNVLGSHPLALIQAGHLLLVAIFSYSNVTRSINGNVQRLLEFHPTQAQSRYGHVHATFAVSAHALDSSEDETTHDTI